MSSLRGLLPQRTTSYSGRSAIITGTFVSTLDDITSATSGTVTNSGTFVATLSNMTSNTSGIVEADITGIFVSTLSNMTSITSGTIGESELELPVSTRIVNILTRVRDTLADPNKTRWSDERLLRLLDEAQQDVAKQSQLLKGTYDLSLVIGQAEYDLPEDLWLITRATFDDYEIPLKSYDKMDEEAAKYSLARSSSLGVERTRGYSVNVDASYRRSNWEVAEGAEIQALIFDNRNMQKIRVFPIPDAAIAEDTYTFENAGVPEYAGDELLGITTSITDYSLSSIYGVVTSLYEPAIQNEIFDSPYGVVTEITESKVVVKIWYIKTPAQLTTLSDELELPRMFDVALKHYVVGHALRDDIEAQYRQMGAECLQLYERELDIARSTNSSDGTRNPTSFTPTYRGGFE